MKFKKIVALILTVPIRSSVAQFAFGANFSDTANNSLSVEIELPANDVGMYRAGRRYDFNEIDPITQPPVLNHVTIEPMEDLPGAYILTMDDYWCREDGDPYFYWRASEGTFMEASRDGRTMEFRADPGTGGRSIPIRAHVGDGFGAEARLIIWVEGRE